MIPRHVQFRDFFFGDQLVSIAIVLTDLEYTICFFAYDAWKDTTICQDVNPYAKVFFFFVSKSRIYVANHILFSIYLENSSKLSKISWYKVRNFIGKFSNYSRNPVLKWGILKYVIPLFVVVFSSFTQNHRPILYIWIIISVINTLYAYVWDIVQDWSLNVKKFKVLREKKMYPKYVWHKWTNLLTSKVVLYFHFYQFGTETHVDFNDFSELYWNYLGPFVVFDCAFG